jgi:hypothetical protein
VLAFSCCGCSALIDPGSLLTRCDLAADGSDPCQAVGLTCVDGTCQACKPQDELCDGRDNDCDGKVDEGFDPDGDGFTWCGGGNPELVDCAPDDPTIHPAPVNPDGTTGAPPKEACDGKDNDCDGKVDEDPSCAPLRTCVQTGCRAPLTCDMATNQCLAPRSTGSSCKSDAECGDGFCISPGALGLGNVLMDSLCGTACCKDSDCKSGSVCTQSGSGARVCLPADIAGRQTGASGSRCTQSSQCASGVCQMGHCVDTCTSDADCAGETCRLNNMTTALLSGAGAFVCGQAAGRGDAGDLCTGFDPTSCKSGICYGVNCASPCGSQADCPEGLTCEYVSMQGLLGGEGRLTLCVVAMAQSTTSPMSSTMVPTPTPPGVPCCTSSDCSSGEACKPMQASNDWGMYCAAQAVVQ